MTGRQRHLLVDTMGVRRAVVVHAANIQDRDGARYVVRYIADWRPRGHTVVGDGGYAGTRVGWVRATCGEALTVVKRADDLVGFEVLPTRWIVARTFAWLGTGRRPRTDDAGRTELREACVAVAMPQLMLRRSSRQTAF